MNLSILSPFRRSLVLGMAVAAAGLLAPVQQAVAAGTSKTGVVCTTGAAGAPVFTLTAKEGYIQLPDGNTMYMWSYASGGSDFQYPGPVLCVNEGDTVTVVLSNQLAEDVSIMFPGQEGVLANGSAAQPQGSGAGLTSLTNVAPVGGSVTYSFVASRAGTFVYESGTEPQKQVRMGLFGMLIVRPAGHADQLNARSDSQFTSASATTVNEEFMVQLSEIDPYQHWAAEAGETFDLSTYHPRYWLMNGRGFPDTIADNHSAFLPAQPYGALARINPWDPVKHPLPGAIRYMNLTTTEIPFHPHGQNGTVVGRDGAALQTPDGKDASFEKFVVNIGPGQTYDVLFQWYDAEAYSPTAAAGSAHEFPVAMPQIANLSLGMFYSGSPFLGMGGPLAPGASSLNTCGEFYIISHNHALHQIASWGVNITGPITFLRVDPPLPNNCPQ